jgi:hypothetical protein
MTVIEKLENLFKKNDEWNDCNWTTPGGDNPYPPRIKEVFIPYFNGRYKMTATWHDERGREHSEVVSKDTLWDSTDHAWFDCSDIDGCIDLLEIWVRDYYEDYRSGEECHCVVKVETTPRRKRK